MRVIRGVEGRYWDENIFARSNGLREKTETAIRVGGMDLPEKRKIYTSTQEEDVDSHACCAAQQ